MAFWDTSAIVPLCTRQPANSVVRRLVGRDQRIVVWWGTLVEVRSALSRLIRQDVFTAQTHGEALKRLRALQMKWDEVLPTERLRALAEGLPDRFGLRAGDAFQLAAALRWCDERPRRRPFVCLDRRLGEAAAGLGFEVEGR